MERVAREVPEAARKLADAFWPGPLTMIVWKSDAVPMATTGGMDTVAVRMPNHPVALDLIRKSGCLVFSIALSQTRIRDGRIVTHPITPKTTPFAITIPRSFPRVKLIKHSAINPATVVMELLTTEVIVLEIACAMARFLSPSNRSFCS